MKKSRLLILFVSLLLFLTGCSKMTSDSNNDLFEEKYIKAKKLVEAGDYETSMDYFEDLGDYKDSKEYLSYFKVVPQKMHTEHYKNTYLRGEVRLPEHSVEYEYDERGNLLKARDTGDVHKIVEFVYDNNDDVVEIMLVNEATNKREKVKYNYNYVRDANMRIIQKEAMCDFDDMSYTENNVYDNNGVLIEKHIAFKDGNILVKEYTYQNGKKTKEKWSISRNGGWIKTPDLEIGRQIVGVYMEAFAHKGVGEIVYEYNDDGNMEKMIVSSKNPTNMRGQLTDTFIYSDYKIYYAPKVN